MSPALIRRALAPLVLVLLLAGLLAAPSQARKARWPGRVGTPSSASTTAGKIDLSWGFTSSTTRYRMLWSPKPYGGYQVHTTTPYPGWIPTSPRRTSLKVGQSYSSNAGQRAIQTALPYGNPLFFRLQANNAYAGAKATHSSPWTRAVWPRIAAPAPGFEANVGTYSLRQNTSQAAVERTAGAIQSNGLSVVALQEARTDQGVSTSERIARQLGWVDVPATMQQHLIYDPSVYTATNAGQISVRNYGAQSATLPRLTMPYARLVPRDAGASPFWVFSGQFVGSKTNQSLGNRQTAADAQEAATQVSQVAGSEPAVVAGDFGVGREPYVDSSTGPQQTFVKWGYWDARATLSRSGVQYGTNNLGLSRQKDAGVGVYSRSTYIMLKGIHGSLRYVNVANQYHPVTDHNLVWSKIRVPATS